AGRPPGPRGARCAGADRPPPGSRALGRAVHDRGQRPVGTAGTPHVRCVVAAADRHHRRCGLAPDPHARALRDHLPLTRAALQEGRISSEHVTVLVREALLTERLRAQLADAEMGEAFLVDKAQELDATRFAKLVKTWAIAAD